MQERSCSAMSAGKPVSVSAPGWSQRTTSVCDVLVELCLLCVRVCTCVYLCVCTCMYLCVCGAGYASVGQQ